MAGIKLPNNKAAHELTREELEEVVIKQAWRDETFRAELTRNPKQAIEKLLSIDIPGELKVNVVQDTPDQITVVLPYFPPPMGELSESQLAQASGGAETIGAIAPAATYGCCTSGNCTVLCSWGSKFGTVTNPDELLPPPGGGLPPRPPRF